MKKLVISLVASIGFFVVNAQTDSLKQDSLQQYVGKYKFPDGSPVSEVGVVIEDGVLTATSAMGNSELKKTGDKDVFDIVAFSGTASFKRGDDGKVKSVRIQVQDVDMEGVRESGGSPPKNIFPTQKSNDYFSIFKK